ncbi:MAG: recombination mediator RecR [Patescibacteria group bacterium]|nr:recombination mediator RecR [Patescibacteria group bacterium]
MNYPQSIENLIKQFSSLPSVGRKTAERYVFYLLKQKPSYLKIFSKHLLDLNHDLVFCQHCFSPSETNPCEICSNPQRKNDQLCLIANFQDLLAIENTKLYSGKYFILGGLLSSIEGLGPEKLKLKELAKEINERLKKYSQIEIILALSPTLEGETTSLYLQNILKNKKIKISKLAQGLSTGLSLEYADQNTLSNAFKFRGYLE